MSFFFREKKKINPECLLKISYYCGKIKKCVWNITFCLLYIFYQIFSIVWKIKTRNTNIKMKEKDFSFCFLSDFNSTFYKIFVDFYFSSYIFYFIKIEFSIIFEVSRNSIYRMSFHLTKKAKPKRICTSKRIEKKLFKFFFSLFLNTFEKIRVYKKS